MNPQERVLLERSLKLAEENNDILRSLRRGQRWSTLWGFVKLALFVIPFVIGYLYLEPYIGSLGESFKQAQSVLSTFR